MPRRIKLIEVGIFQESWGENRSYVIRAISCTIEIRGFVIEGQNQKCLMDYPKIYWASNEQWAFYSPILQSKLFVSHPMRFWSRQEAEKYAATIPGWRVVSPEIKG